MPLDPASLQAAIHETLQATVPQAHGFATVIDPLTGAHVAIATRLGEGWNLDVDAGYAWAGPQPGLSTQFSIGKSWS